MAVFKPLIFSELSIVPVRVISSFVVNLLAKIGNIMDITKFSSKNPLYINKVLRPYAICFGIRAGKIRAKRNYWKGLRSLCGPCREVHKFVKSS